MHSNDFNYCGTTLPKGSVPEVIDCLLKAMHDLEVACAGAIETVNSINARVTANTNNIADSIEAINNNRNQIVEAENKIKALEEKAFSSDNPPPYPVTKVNGQTGNVYVDSLFSIGNRTVKSINYENRCELEFYDWSSIKIGSVGLSRGNIYPNLEIYTANHNEKCGILNDNFIIQAESASLPSSQSTLKTLYENGTRFVFSDQGNGVMDFGAIVLEGSTYKVLTIM